MIRVELPAHLREIARVRGEVVLEVDGPVTLEAVLNALETKYPALQGALRDHTTKRRRPFVRFFACQQDLSLEDPGILLPDAIVTSAEPLLIVGAIAGGSF